MFAIKDRPPFLLFICASKILSFFTYLSRDLPDLEGIRVLQEYPETMGSLVWMVKEDLKVRQVLLEKTGYLECPEELEAKVCQKGFDHYSVGNARMSNPGSKGDRGSDGTTGQKGDQGDTGSEGPGGLPGPQVWPNIFTAHLTKDSV